MTPIDKVFMLDVNQCLNKELRQEVRPNWSDHVLEVRPGHHSGVVRPIRHINHVWCHRSTVLLGPILPQPCHHIDGVNTGDLERVFCQTPRSSLCWCHSHTVLQISNSGRSRIPVYRESKDYIIGVLLVKSLLTVEEDVLIDKLVRISVQYHIWSAHIYLWRTGRAIAHFVPNMQHLSRSAPQSALHAPLLIGSSHNAGTLEL